MKNFVSSIFLIFMFAATETVAQKDPLDIFEQVWSAFDTSYSGFIHKDIDWDKMHTIYRERLTENTSETELFKIITEMLRHLNDNHVQISLEAPKKHFSAGKLGYLIDEIGIDSVLDLYRTLPISKKYFINGLKKQNGFSYGWLKDSIGYFHFMEFKNLMETQNTMDTLMRYFSSSKALIIDVRRNMGGEDSIGKAIADYFVDKKRDYMLCSYKNGSKHDDFTEKNSWYLEPNKFFHYDKAIVLLIDMTSFSEAEIFAMAMREIPHVKLVGNNTSGAYADSEWRILPCGWNVCIPYSLHTDKNGFCWEGIGIPPDYYIHTNPKKSISEKDELIEFAFKLINHEI